MIALPQDIVESRKDCATSPSESELAAQGASNSRGVLGFVSAPRALTPAGPCCPTALLLGSLSASPDIERRTPRLLPLWSPEAMPPRASRNRCTPARCKLAKCASSLARTDPMTGTDMAFPKARLPAASEVKNSAYCFGKPCKAARSDRRTGLSSVNTPLPSPSAKTCNSGPAAVKQGHLSSTVGDGVQAVRSVGSLDTSTNAY